LLLQFVERLSANVTRLGNRTRQTSESTSIHVGKRAPADKLKPMAMEWWLRDLPLAPKSKTHVREIIHLVFKCAERWAIIELGKSPVSLVRVKNGSKRFMRPRVLDVEEFFALLKHMSEPNRTMVLPHSAWASALAKFWACNGAISISRVALFWSRGWAEGWTT
jgi:hypothetical protein